MVDPAENVEMMVVDGSVATKWHLTDEPDADLALAVLDRFAAGQFRLVAPNHIRSEAPSAITVATRRCPPRLSRDQGAAAIAEFLALGMEMFDDDELVVADYGVAHQYGRAFYDGLYLALAQRLCAPLILADARFFALIRHLPHVIWPGDYNPDVH